jgi:hypothetical protein
MRNLVFLLLCLIGLSACLEDTPPIRFGMIVYDSVHSAPLSAPDIGPARNLGHYPRVNFMHSTIAASVLSALVAQHTGIHECVAPSSSTLIALAAGRSRSAKGSTAS